MASEGEIFHNPSFPGSAGAWIAWAENVGTGLDVDQVHQLFMASPTHRRNILNPELTLVGVGVTPWTGGIMVVEDFLTRSGDTAPSPPSSTPSPAAPAPPQPGQPAPPPGQPAPPPESEAPPPTLFASGCDPYLTAFGASARGGEITKRPGTLT